MSLVLQAQSLALQCKTLQTLILSERWKGPERYPAGTIVDGKNVGGKGCPVLNKLNKMPRSAIFKTKF